MTTATKSRNKYFNPNPLKREGADCVVRAFCKAMVPHGDTEGVWDDVYDDLCLLGKELKDMPNSNTVWMAYLEDHPLFIEHTLRIKKGMRRPTVDSFAREHNKGVYILRVANHLVTVVDGYYYDTWDCGNKSIYKYWERKPLN